MDDRYRAVVQKIRESSVGFLDAVSDPDEDIAITDVDGNAVVGFGDPGETIVIKLDCTWPVLTPLISPFFPDGEYNFPVFAAMRNEAFAESGP